MRAAGDAALLRRARASRRSPAASRSRLDGRGARTPGKRPLVAPTPRARGTCRGGMGGAGRDDRPGVHAGDAPRQFGDRRRRRRRSPRPAPRSPLRRGRSRLLSRRGAGSAGRAAGCGLRSRARLGARGARRAFRRRRRRHPCRASRRRRSSRRRAGGRGVRRPVRGRRAACDDEPDRLASARADDCRGRAERPKPRGAPPMSTRISRSANGARTTRRWRAAPRAGAIWRRRRRSLAAI